MAMRNPPPPIASMHARRRWRLRRRQSLRPAPPLVVPSTSSRAILRRSAGPLAPITMKLNFQAFKSCCDSPQGGEVFMSTPT